ncbi:MAG: hypothetical protein MJ114_03370 [Acetatifactor sp.]|nr:hypothetical protein [Acetatifactor sp.]
MKPGKRELSEVILAVLLSAVLLVAAFIMCKNNIWLFVLMVVVIYLNLGLFVFVLVDSRRKRGNGKDQLLVKSLDALGDSFPRIARINYMTGECIIIRDREHMETTFVSYDWEQFRVDFLKRIHPEEVEKCRAFTSADYMRRVCEEGQSGATCIYRRLYKGEYIWIQTSILPLHGEEDAGCILMYAKNVDESVKADELHKNHMGWLLRKAKNAERAMEIFLRNLAEGMQVPVDAAASMNALTIKAIEQGDLEQAGVYLRTSEQLCRYLQIQTEDLIQLGVKQGQRISSSKHIFSLEELMEGCRNYYNETAAEHGGIVFTLTMEDSVKGTYQGDDARLIQILNVLITVLYRYCREKGSITVQVSLAGRSENSDSIVFRGVSSTTAGKDCRSAIEEHFEDLYVSMGDEESVPTNVQTYSQALKALGGTIAWDEKAEKDHFILTVNLERVQE